MTILYILLLENKTANFLKKCKFIF